MAEFTKRKCDDGVYGRSAAGAMAISLGVMAATGCAGPQPLERAIDRRDEASYVAHLNAVNGDASPAYTNWMINERGATMAEVRRADEGLSETRNPFNAHGDRGAVSRGAVTYKLHCVRCHGEDARGRGPSTLKDYPATDFKTFGKRFAATLHRGAPRKWFRVIRDGAGDVVEYPDEKTTAMPAFGDELAREQIWLVITYLQSLDVHLHDSPDLE